MTSFILNIINTIIVGIINNNVFSKYFTLNTDNILNINDVNNVYLFIFLLVSNKLIIISVNVTGYSSVNIGIEYIKMLFNPKFDNANDNNVNKSKYFL